MGGFNRRAGRGQRRGGGFGGGFARGLHAFEKRKQERRAADKARTARHPFRGKGASLRSPVDVDLDPRVRERLKAAAEPKDRLRKGLADPRVRERIRGELIDPRVRERGKAERIRGELIDPREQARRARVDRLAKQVKAARAPFRGKGGGRGFGGLAGLAVGVAPPPPQLIDAPALVAEGATALGGFVKGLFGSGGGAQRGERPSARPTPNATPTPEIRTAERVSPTGRGAFSTARKRMRRAKRNLGR